MKQFVRLGVVLMVVLALFATVSAHEGREVGDGKYEIVFGWRVEPAYTNLLNGPEIHVNAIGTDEQPVEGLDETLQIEVAYGGKTKLLKLRAGEEAGNYTADLIPTQPGDYSFHLTGKIGDATIDETFDSAQGEFSSVNPITDIQFP
ncbi:MAG: hypothetical protein GC179_15995 [Anaerolineaceae bacterium]|nr:hypothetical protein [Anaerolineaceae bacterium]